MLRKITVIFGITLILSGCYGDLSPEQKAKIQELRTELDTTKKEVVETEEKYSQYTGGAIKALATVRLEILKTNEALLQQRIQAIESGAKITVQVNATTPDIERANSLEKELEKQQGKVSAALEKASASAGGLIGLMAKMNVTTEENTLSLLRQQYLIAKYGLPAIKLNTDSSSPVTTTAINSPSELPKSEPSAGGDVKYGIISPTILRKHYAKQDYQDYIWLDVKFYALGLDKPARAIKGAIIMTDLFGEEKFTLGWTIDNQIAPGGTYTEKGSGFKYNQFKSDHQWVLTTEANNMQIKFRVDHILYEDGTTREL